jgi:hypothetical protein
MTGPQGILSDLLKQGIALRLSADGNSLTAPAGVLSADQRALVLAHKPELLAFLQAAHQTTAALVDAAMRTCDRHGDDENARQQMRDECLATPPHLRADLLAHFTSHDSPPLTTLHKKEPS